MTRIVEHPGALPLGPAVEVHVRYDPEREFPVYANVEVGSYGQPLEPKPFPEALPVADAFLQAVAYAELSGIACVWIDDPGGYFPLDKRPVRDAREHYFEPCALDRSFGAQRRIWWELGRGRTRGGKMSRRAARFTQADIARAIGAIEQTGANMAVEIGKDGTIRIVPLPLKQDSEEKPPVAIEEEAEAVF